MFESVSHLKFDSERILDHSVETCLGAFAVFVALVDACDHDLVESPELVSNILVNLVLSVTSRALNS